MTSLQNCKEITKGILNIKSLKKNFDDLFSDRSSFSANLEEMLDLKKNIEKMIQELIRDPLKYAKLERLNSSIYDGLRETEPAYDTDSSYSCEDFSISDENRITVMYQDSPGKLHCLGHEQESLFLLESRYIDIPGFVKGVLSHDGKSIIAVVKDVVNGSSLYSIKIFDKSSNEMSHQFLVDSEPSLLSESKKDSHLFVSFSHFTRIFDRDGNLLGTDHTGARKLIELDNGLVARTNTWVYAGEESEKLEIMDSYESNIYRCLDAAPLREKRMVDCISSVFEDEYIYCTSDKIVIRNYKSNESKEISVIEKDKYGSIKYKLEQILESQDGVVVFGLCSDGYIRIWDKVTGQKIKDLKVDRNAVSFSKMIRLADGSIGIGGSYGFVEKWGFRE